MGDTGAEQRVEVGVLGPFWAAGGGRAVELSSGRLRVLLATLAMSAGRPVPVERLVDAIWSGELPADARRTITTYVARLRNAFGPASIGHDPAGYVLRAVPDDVDALRFVRLVDRAGREPMVERELLVEALGLWRGAAFQGLDSAMLEDTEARRLNERRLSALERRIDLDLASGKAAELIAELDHLTAEYPLREPLWSRYLLALGQAGRQAEALEQYERIRERIADELGVDPSPELQRIHAQLLEGTSPATQAGDEAGPAVPRQLPADITGFAGRSAALQALDSLGDPSGNSGGPTVVVIHGAGGAGKTTLAVHWAHRATGLFPDGQLYLNLRGFGPGAPISPAAALGSLLRSLGVSGDELPNELEARTNLLRSKLANRRALIVLDNVYDAEQVRPLLVGTGNSMTIVTSRSQLRGLVAREGAHRIGVEQLDPPDSVALLKAALMRSGEDPDLRGLAELADLCGHLPLALSIAAERVSRYPEAGLSELVGDLRAEQERLDALEIGDDADIRAVFAWSYRDLSPEPAALFRQLGEFPGTDISLQAATALSGRPTRQTRRLLDHLVGVSLVRQRQRDRYELHDLLRVYAADLGRSEDTEADRGAALDRMFAWYLHSALDARMTIRPGARPIDVDVEPSDVRPLTFDRFEDAMAWLDAERETLPAVTEAASRLDRPRTAYLLVSATWHYFQWIRAFDDLFRLGSLGMAAARAGDDVHAEAHCANLLAIVHGELMNLEKARELFEQAVDLFQQVGDGAIHATTLDNLGVLMSRLGRPEDAVDNFERSIAMASRVGRPEGANRTQNNLAAAYIQLSRFEDAARLATATADVYRRRGDRDNEATVLDTLGQALAGEGRHAEAIEHHRRSVQLFEEVEDSWFKGVALTNLGRSLRAAGRRDEARVVWQDALDLFETLGKPDGDGFGRDQLVVLLASVDPQH